MKIYYGIREPQENFVLVENDKLRTVLPLRLDLRNHSPTGFEWGYSGSGPAQLALAILADYLGDDKRALLLHQDFKSAKIAGLTDDEWSISADEIEEWLAEMRQP